MDNGYYDLKPREGVDKTYIDKPSVDKTRNRDIMYKAYDGKEFANFEDVVIYNQMFYDNMMNNEKGKSR